MIGFELSTNYIENPEALFRKTRAKLKKVPTTSLEVNQIRSCTPDFEAMADKTLHEFSAPNIRTAPTVNMGDNGFELKPALINMVKLASFMGRLMKMQALISNTFWRFIVLSICRKRLGLALKKEKKKRDKCLVTEPSKL
jgi:hypothetical protein